MLSVGRGTNSCVPGVARIQSSLPQKVHKQLHVSAQQAEAGTQTMPPSPLRLPAPRRAVPRINPARATSALGRGSSALQAWSLETGKCGGGSVVDGASGNQSAANGKPALYEGVHASACTYNRAREPVVHLRDTESGERSLLHRRICHFNSGLQSWLGALGFSLQPKLK